MKRIMLSATAVMLLVSGAFAGTKKEVYTTASSSVQIQQLSQQFKNLPATIPGTIAVQKNLHVYKDATDDDQIINNYSISLNGKGFDEKAMYDTNGLLLGYKDKLKNAPLPAAVTDAVMAKHSAATIIKDKEIIKDAKGVKKDTYTVCFKDGRKHYTARIAADGTIEKMHSHLI